MTTTMRRTTDETDPRARHPGRSGPRRRLPSSSRARRSRCVRDDGAARAEGALTNGANHDGAISTAGKVDTWTFPASAGDAIVLRAGQLTDPRQLRAADPPYDPSNALLATTRGTWPPRSRSPRRRADLHRARLRRQPLPRGRLDQRHRHLSPAPGQVPGSITTSPGTRAARSPTVRRRPARSTWAIWTCGPSPRARAAGSSCARARSPTPGTSSRGCACTARRERCWERTRGTSRRRSRSPRRESGTFTVVVGGREPSHSGDSSGTRAATACTWRGRRARSRPPRATRGASRQRRRHAGNDPRGRPGPVELHGERGEGIVVRAGEVTDAGNFEPWIRLYGPTGRSWERAAGTSRRRSRSRRPRAARSSS
jgi:hypothetical protein